MALALALPVVLWQVWAFLAPAVEQDVQRTIAAFVVLATLLFFVGVFFGYFVVLTRAVDFLTGSTRTSTTSRSARATT